MKKLTLGITICCLLSIMSGCSNTTYEFRSKQTVAVVNREKIKLEDVDSSNKYYIKSLKDKYGEEFEKGMIEALNNTSDIESKEKIEADIEEINSFRSITLDSIVEEKIMVAKGRQLGVLTEIDEKYERFLESIPEHSSELWSEEDRVYSGDRTLGKLAKDAVFKHLEKDITVSNEEIEEYYNDNIDQYVKKAGYEVKELFFPVSHEDIEDVCNIANRIYYDMITNCISISYCYDKFLNGENNYGTEVIAKEYTLPFEEISNNNEYYEWFNYAYIGACSPVNTKEGFYIPYVTNIRQVDDVQTLDNVSHEIESTVKSNKIVNNYYEKLEQYSDELKVKTFKDKLLFS